MIKIKITNGNAKMKVEGRCDVLLAEAGVAIWSIKDMLRDEDIINEDDLKNYLMTFVLADNWEQTTEFLNDLASVKTREKKTR